MITTKNICTYRWGDPNKTLEGLLGRCHLLGFSVCAPLISGGAFRISTFQKISKKYSKKNSYLNRITYLLKKTATDNSPQCPMLTTETASAERQRLRVRGCRGAETHGSITTQSGRYDNGRFVLEIKDSF